MTTLFLKEDTTAVRTAESPGNSVQLGHRAAAALLAEANLPDKPGLVGPDGVRRHTDMDVALMRRSARVLEPTFRDLAQAGAQLEIGQELRDEVGRIGRRGEKEMMLATGDVNTHRGAIWNLGLMAIATAGLIQYDPAAPLTATAITRRAGQLAAIRDSFLDMQPRPGASARRRYRVGGALSEASSGFPHVRTILYAMGIGDDLNSPPPTHSVQIRGLLASMSSLDDTCLLHRGGREGLEFVQKSAAALLNTATPFAAIDAAALAEFDQQLTNRRLSPGGSADMLACALFLTSISGDKDADDH